MHTASSPAEPGTSAQGRGADASRPGNFNNLPAQPGTAAHAAIEYLQHLGPGVFLNSAALCEAIGQPGKKNGFSKKMRAALNAGLVLQERDPKTKGWRWGLPGADDQPVQRCVDARNAKPVFTRGVSSIFDLAERMVNA